MASIFLQFPALCPYFPAWSHVVSWNNPFLSNLLWSWCFIITEALRQAVSTLKPLNHLSKLLCRHSHGERFSSTERGSFPSHAVLVFPPGLSHSHAIPPPPDLQTSAQPLSSIRTALHPWIFTPKSLISCLILQLSSSRATSLSPYTIAANCAPLSKHSLSFDCYLLLLILTSDTKGSNKSKCFPSV